RLGPRGNRGLEVVAPDLEVHHLRLLAGLLRPRRRLVPGRTLNVEMHAACWIPQLGPVRRCEVTHLEPEKSFVESCDRSDIGTVDGDAHPSTNGSAHLTSLPQSLVGRLYRTGIRPLSGPPAPTRRRLRTCRPHSSSARCSWYG